MAASAPAIRSKTQAERRGMGQQEGQFWACLFNTKAKAIPHTSNKALLTSHWQECFPMATTSFKEGWEGVWAQSCLKQNRKEWEEWIRDKQLAIPASLCICPDSCTHHFLSLSENYGISKIIFLCLYGSGMVHNLGAEQAFQPLARSLSQEASQTVIHIGGQWNIEILPTPAINCFPSSIIFIF